MTITTASCQNQKEKYTGIYLYNIPPVNNINKSIIFLKKILILIWRSSWEHFKITGHTMSNSRRVSKFWFDHEIFVQLSTKFHKKTAGKYHFKPKMAVNDWYLEMVKVADGCLKTYKVTSTAPIFVSADGHFLKILLVLDDSHLEKKLWDQHGNIYGTLYMETYWLMITGWS